MSAFFRNRTLKLLLVSIAILSIFWLVNRHRYPDLGSQLVSQVKFHYHEDIDRDLAVKRNYEQLQEIMKTEIGLPKVDNLVMAPIGDDYQRANATLLILARNVDANKVVKTINRIEKHFNSKFHYPYVFLNDEAFSKKFIEKVSNVVSGECYFEQVDADVWKQPSHIDSRKQNKNMKELKKMNIAYADKVSYHNMCRFYSINFYKHPRLQQFKYYWRFEPDTDYFCDIDYDVFKFMESNNKVYGFTIALYDAEQTLPSLWPLTMDFIKNHPQYLHPNAAIDWLTEDMMNPQKNLATGGYSTCHFWSNFEIADMDFYRGEAYSGWAKALEKSGGFYYERWGDAPVHSVGVGLFADKSQIHWFRDIGYKHHPYTNAPNSQKCVSNHKVAVFTYDHLRDQNCLSNWWNYGMSNDERSLY